jgi:hypothetical protein
MKDLLIGNDLYRVKENIIRKEKISMFPFNNIFGGKLVQCLAVTKSDVQCDNKETGTPDMPWREVDWQTKKECRMPVDKNQSFYPSGASSSSSEVNSRPLIQNARSEVRVDSSQKFYPSGGTPSGSFNGGGSGNGGGGCCGCAIIIIIAIVIIGFVWMNNSKKTALAEKEKASIEQKATKQKAEDKKRKIEEDIPKAENIVTKPPATDK